MEPPSSVVCPRSPALSRTSGAERERLHETLRARQLTLLEALIVIVRRAQMTVTERVVLGEALDVGPFALRHEPGEVDGGPHGHR